MTFRPTRSRQFPFSRQVAQYNRSVGRLWFDMAAPGTLPSQLAAVEIFDAAAGATVERFVGL